MERQSMVLRIPVKLNEELKEKSKEKGISKHAFILEMLWKWKEVEESKI